jgi:hypothetical protein
MAGRLRLVSQCTLKALDALRRVLEISFFPTPPSQLLLLRPTTPQEQSSDGHSSTRETHKELHGFGYA